MHKKAKNICENLLSFPTWERGLKCMESSGSLSKNVVPHAGTWIEMRISTQSWKNTMSFPTAGTWIEFSVALVTSVSGVGRSPRGTWVEMERSNVWNACYRRSPRGTWIEITKRKSNGVVHGVFPMREQKPQKPEIAINTCI